MATSGLLSILCALGTIIGIALFVIGLLTKAGKSKRIGGALLFVLSFSGLFYLLANFGSFKSPEEGGAMPVHQGERYQVYRYDRLSISDDNQLPKVEPLFGLLETPIFVYPDSIFKVYSGGRLLFERRLNKNAETWNFDDNKQHPDAPFYGDFMVDEDPEFLILNKKVADVDGLEVYERLMLLK